MIRIFIEGTTMESNGRLREGFGRLFEQVKSKHRIHIQMGDDKGRTIRKFLDYEPEKGEIKVLLTDSDDDKSTIEAQRSKLPKPDQALYFFMVRETEAWFFAQPEVLQSYFKGNFSLGKYKSKNPEFIESPSDVLADLTKSTQKGKYHKVKHAWELLKLLDIKVLVKQFDELARLVKFLEA